MKQFLNDEGVIISRWYRDLKGNYEKYSVMLMGNGKTNNAAINVNIDGENVEFKPALRLLGVIIDNK